MSIYVDASDTRWEIVSELIQTNGYWAKEEKQTSINARELKTILFAVKLHAEKYKKSTIHIHTDNTTAPKHVKESGGTASVLLQTLILET